MTLHKLAVIQAHNLILEVRNKAPSPIKDHPRNGLLAGKCGPWKKMIAKIQFSHVWQHIKNGYCEKNWSKTLFSAQNRGAQTYCYLQQINELATHCCDSEQKGKHTARLSASLNLSLQSIFFRYEAFLRFRKILHVSCYLGLEWVYCWNAQLKVVLYWALIWVEAQPPWIEAALLLLVKKSSRLSGSSHTICHGVKDWEVRMMMSRLQLSALVCEPPVGGEVGRAVLHLLRLLLPLLLPLHRHPHRPTEDRAHWFHLRLQRLGAGKSARKGGGKGGGGGVGEGKLLLLGNWQGGLETGPGRQTQRGTRSAHVGGVLTVAHAGAAAVLALPARSLPARGCEREETVRCPGPRGAGLHHLHQGSQSERFVDIVLRTCEEYHHQTL